MAKAETSSFPSSCPLTNNGTMAKKLEEWRGNRFKTEYLPLVRPFSAVPDLLRRVRDAGLRIAVASSAKKDEVDKYLDIARITDLVDLTTSSDDVEESKPAPDIFEIVLKKLKIEGADAVAIGDTPYDAEAAGKAKIATIGVLCGGFRRARYDKPDASRYIPDRPRCSRASRTLCSRGRQNGGSHGSGQWAVRGRPMARKLKTYQTSLGFFDLAIAAPSMKAALEAWGADSNLFHQGAAKESDDPDVIAATMKKPGVVLRRPVKSDVYDRRSQPQIRKQLDTVGESEISTPWVSPKSKLTKPVRKPKATRVEPKFTATSEGLLCRSSFKDLDRT